MNAPVRFQQSWSPADDAILIAERAKNKTCAAIAALIGRTKNAVIGRVSRLIIDGKMEGKAQNAGRVQKPRADGFANWVEADRAKKKYAADQARAMRLLRARDAPPPIVGQQAQTLAERFQPGYLGQRGRVSIEELTSATCRWPVDMKRGPVRYCGDTPETGSSYCPHHRERSLGRWS